MIRSGLLRRSILAVVFTLATLGAPAAANATTAATSVAADGSSAWTETPTADLLFPNGQFNSVSCSEGTCLAVGYFTDPDGRMAPMAEATRTDDHGWEVAPVTLPD